MSDFPTFMKSPANRIATSSTNTPGVEGYVYDGADGSQITYWICHQDGTSAEHVHEFDEYMVVVEGKYTLIIGGCCFILEAGQEHVIPKGVAHAGEVIAGTRTIHAFGGRRAQRE